MKILLCFQDIWCPLICGGCDLLMFLGVSLENEIFLNIYILNFPWSPFLSQWSVSSFAGFFFVVFFFNSHWVPHFSNSFQVLNVLDNSRNAGAEVSPTPVFNKTRQKQNNTTSHQKKKKKKRGGKNPPWNQQARTEEKYCFNLGAFLKSHKMRDQSMFSFF